MTNYTACMPCMHLWKLSLCSDFPKLWHCLCLAVLYPHFTLSDPRKALPILLFYSDIRGGLNEALCLCTCHEVNSYLPQDCVPPLLRHIFVCIFYVNYLLPGYVTFPLSLNTRIVTLTAFNQHVFVPYPLSHVLLHVPTCRRMRIFPLSYKLIEYIPRSHK